MARSAAEADRGRSVAAPAPAGAGFAAVIALPFGPFGIRTADAGLSGLVFLPPGTPLRAPADALARSAAEALLAWIDDPHHRFALPLAECGSPFQRRVWAAISAIPPGRTETYGSLARTLGSAARAVGQACGANPFPLVVPCHRVTAATGIGGFANARDGWLLEAKRWLLAHEARR
ncbi:MAG: methylated-DNA--[protein]-cysteine S-methyltransferase [Thauera phenolivorans]|uniref:Methylated-DNA--[protein]-cysteine S-methyltransferase n=1 Tax=Thauera phenolivorans TaxID=1792543 RepID=A0A7X7R875_9RHOO|nr:methylated-DNA--[protein]-cysteine S-methyltransferase [Thauera phenolivorans]